MFSGLGAASSAQAAIYAQRALAAREKAARVRPVRLIDLVGPAYPFHAERGLTYAWGVPVVGLDQAVQEHGPENIYLAPGRLLVVREGPPHTPRVPRKRED